MSAYDHVDSYNLDEDFEDTVVLLAMASTRFYNRVGHAVDPAALDKPECVLAMKACHQVKQDSGHAPGGVGVVLQRLVTLHDRGHIAQEEVDAVRALTIRAQEAGVPPDDAAISELAAILRHRKRREALDEASRAQGKRAPLKGAIDMLEAAEAIGREDTSLGMRSSLDTTDLDALLAAAKMSTGIPEVDMALRGGIHPSTLTSWLAPSGGGKSFALVQQAVASIRRRELTTVATNELPAPMVDLRIKCALAEYPIDAVMDGKRGEFHKRLEEILPTVGPWYVKYFNPSGTATADVFRWVDAVEQHEGAKAPLLVVDYADKLGVTADNEYKAMRGVYDSLRDWAIANVKWVVTASQSTRGKDGKLIGLNNFSDSMHKPRIADLCISINIQEDNSSNLLYVCKNRLGESYQKIGPLPNRFAYGLLADPSGTPVAEAESLEAQIAILRDGGCKKPGERGF